MVSTQDDSQCDGWERSRRHVSLAAGLILLVEHDIGVWMSYHRPDIKPGQLWSRRDEKDVFVFIQIEPRRRHVSRRCVFHDTWDGRRIRVSVPNVVRFMELVIDVPPQ